MSCEAYFRRFGFCERQITGPVPPHLGIIVVIPCCDEPNLLQTLEALGACAPPRCAVEVIVVFNAGVGPGLCPADTDPVEHGRPSSPQKSGRAHPDIVARNEQALESARLWAKDLADANLTFHFLNFPQLPKKHAGVGLARKIGMDEALRRFADLERTHRGIIACFDADCRCDPNYLVALENHFASNPASPGCSIYFEHPLDAAASRPILEAIVRYELHLRYYVQALRYAGFPFAFHTVGSSMAVRAHVYQEQGGMNRRQAGEDFYFLQKIIPLGGYRDLTTTRVLPSPRPSLRVPFGTGRAVQEFLDGAPLKSYALEGFLELKRFFAFFSQTQVLERLAVDSWAPLPGSVLARFLTQERFDDALTEIRANTASPDSFRKRFFGWFNGFRVMKFLHFARDHAYGARPVEEEASKLLSLLAAPTHKIDCSLPELLARFRDLDRLNPFES